MRLLVFTAVGSFFIRSEQAVQEVIIFISEAIPFSQDLIEQNVELVLERRGTVGVVAVLTLLWSASSVFTLLTRIISRAWPERRPARDPSRKQISPRRKKHEEKRVHEPS